MNKPKSKAGGKPTRKITQEDLDNNPEFEAQGLKVGDPYPGADTPEKVESVYPLYEKWKVNVEPKRGEGDRVVAHNFTAIKKLSANPAKIEDNVANQLNAQSHNSGVRYYPAETITNGHEETVPVK